MYTVTADSKPEDTSIPNTLDGMIFLKYDEKGFQKKGEWIAANIFEIKKSDFLEKNKHLR